MSLTSTKIVLLIRVHELQSVLCFKAELTNIPYVRPHQQLSGVKI